MFDIASFETRKKIKGCLLFSLFMILYVSLVIAIFPSIEQAGLEELYSNLPEELRTSFLGDFEINNIQGYLAIELYNVGWILFVGIYFAYSTASSIAKEIEDTSIDLLLSHPISRTRIVLGKFLSVIPILLLVDVLIYFSVYFGVIFINEEVEVYELFLLHSVSIFYFLACASLGLLFSVIFDEQRKAQILSIGAIFFMFLVDTVTLDTDYEWIGDIAFTRYIDPGEILINGEIDFSGLSFLVVITIILVIISSEYFERKEIF